MLQVYFYIMTNKILNCEISQFVLLFVYKKGAQGVNPERPILLFSACQKLD